MIHALALAALILTSQPPEAHLRHKFGELCDVACAELNADDRTIPFYVDSYAVRALAVAYDMTGKPVYLAACRKWSDRMVDSQDHMTPTGAYYMHYGRKPGETQGEWYVADSASIAMGILATALRCPDPKDRAGIAVR